MKLFVTITLLILQYILSAQSVYDALIEKTQTVAQSQVMISQILSYYAKQRPDVPQKVWQEIQSEINYQSFVTEVKEIYRQYYTETEAQEIIDTIDQYGINAVTYKPEITEAMYELGRKFGKQIGEHVKEKLKELGY